MKQRLLSLEERLQELWQDVGGARRPAPTKVHLRATAAVDKQLEKEKAKTLLQFVERHLVPTKGNLTEAEGYLRSAKAHLEATEAQLAAAKAPPMSDSQDCWGNPALRGGQRPARTPPASLGTRCRQCDGTGCRHNSPAEHTCGAESSRKTADGCWQMRA